MKATLVLLLAAPAVSLAAASITVEAGDYDRRETVVECRLPAGVSGLTGGGETSAVQHDAEGQAWFVVRNLKHGETRTYQFIKADSVQMAQAKSGPGAVTL